MTEPLNAKTHLIFLILIEVLIYFDRGFVNGCVSNLEEHFPQVKVGILGTALLAGFTLSSPFFAAWGRKSNVRAVYSSVFGLCLWVLAAMLTALFGTEFYTLTSMRFLTGIGQAGVLSFAPAMVGQSAPPKKSSQYIGIYFTALYLGAGLGNVTGGKFNSWDTSRYAFFGIGAAMVPLIALMIFWRNRLVCPSSEDSQEGHSKMKLFKLFASRKAFWAMSFGYGFFIFFIGGLAFWASRLIEQTYDIEKETAALLFGIATVTTGIFGTIIGGKLVDHYVSKYTDTGHAKSKGISKDSLTCFLSARISAILVACAIPFIFGALFMSTEYGFMGLMTPAMLLLFTTTAPCNIGIMNSVPEAARGQAMGLSVLISHIIGDIPSPSIIGLIKESSIWGGDIKRANFYTLLICNCFLALGTIVWFAASKIAYTEGRAIFIIENKNNHEAYLEDISLKELNK